MRIRKRSRQRVQTMISAQKQTQKTTTISHSTEGCTSLTITLSITCSSLTCEQLFLCSDRRALLQIGCASLVHVSVRVSVSVWVAAWLLRGNEAMQRRPQRSVARGLRRPNDARGRELEQAALIRMCPFEAAMLPRAARAWSGCRRCRSVRAWPLDGASQAAGSWAPPACAHFGSDIAAAPL